MTVFQVKAIKPAKMNIPQVKQEILKELKAQGKLVEKEYQKTTRSWSGAKPKFESIVDVSGNPAVLTGPTGSALAVNKFVWLDFGTRAHTITARRARRLRFRAGGFKAKTKPGVIGSSRGSPASGPVVYKRSVRHPGTTARRFSETIQKRRKQPFIDAIIKAKNRGLEKLYK